jgi:tetratricopeptide (TPR) repeat protein
MRLTRNTFLAIGLPVVIALVYVVLFLKPWAQGRPVDSRLTPEESNQLWSECNQLFKSGKYEDALPGMLKLHEAYPGNHIYIEMLADINDHLGRYPQEAEYWEQYFDRAPNPVAACPQIGQAYWKQGKQKEALGAFQRCLDRDPENSDSIFFLAHAFELTGDTARAGELYEKGLKIAPEYTDLQIGLARVWLREDKLDQAKLIALEAAQRSPQNVDVLLVVGLVYLREGDLIKARGYLEKGVKLSDGYLDFHIALARLDEDEKNFPDAIREYDRILKDRPNDDAIRAKRDALMVKQ